MTFTLDTYRNARAEHAFLLRLEGLTYAAIGQRFGRTRERGRQMCRKGARRFARAAHRTRFVLEVEVSR